MSRLELKKRFAKKAEVYFGTDIANLPEVDIENLIFLDNAFLRTKTSPNSESLIII